MGVSWACHRKEVSIGGQMNGDQIKIEFVCHLMFVIIDYHEVLYDHVMSVFQGFESNLCDRYFSVMYDIVKIYRYVGALTVSALFLSNSIDLLFQN